ncbi:MAG TPA: SDR family NAD(P)-dependent oxidoreductase [Nevskia sp.]|nr:SDR family NAD(P)-dependent oxidoreductase [Nevskia sp.]
MTSLHRLLLRPAFAAPLDLSGRKVIVTGTAPGSIGFETARRLAAWGADVCVTTRANPAAVVDALKATGGRGTIEAHALDLSQRDSVRAFSDWYLQRHGGRLDVLVNNGGVHLDLLSQWKEPHLTPDGQEIHWRTNYLGTMHLTSLLLPALLDGAKSTGNARVVNVVSMLHTRGSNAGLFAPQPKYNSWVAYGLSKLALIHATFELQRRHAQQGLRAYCLHPGAVYTNIAGKGLAGNPFIEGMRNAMAPLERFFLLTPEEGAQTQLHCATALDAAGGLYYRNCKPAPASADTQDAVVAGRLWEQTEAWLRQA